MNKEQKISYLPDAIETSDSVSGDQTWYAGCPFCRREVSRNDRYWR